MQSKGEAVLPIVLQHSRLPWRTVCRLLCCSNFAADMVQNRLAASIDVELVSSVSSSMASSADSRSILISFASRSRYYRWLAKHAVLLRSLQQGHYSSSTTQWRFHDHQHWPNEDTALSSSLWQPADVEQLAAALAQAAALPTGLQLQSLQASSLSLLHSCSSCRTLTSLDLNPSKDMLLSSNTPMAIGCFSGLRNQLRHLKLDAGWLRQDNAEPEQGQNTQQIPAVSAPGLGLYCLVRSTLPTLTSLTRLEVTCKWFAEPHILNFAPPNLLELQVAARAGAQCSCYDKQAWPPESLQLGHLTACTSLELVRSDNQPWYWPGFGGIDVSATLPPKLQVLCCGLGSEFHPNSVTPLLPLGQLTQLSLPQCNYTHVSEVQRLSLLTQLKSVHLGYTEPGNTSAYVDMGIGAEYERIAEEHLVAWSVVPGLDSLELNGQRLDPNSQFLPVLAGLTSLTRLVLRDTWFWPNLDDYMAEWEAEWDFGNEGERPGGDANLFALGEALPASLRVLELCEIFPCTPDPTQLTLWVVSNVDVLMGLRALMVDIASLPCLEACNITACHEDCCCDLSPENGPGQCVELLLDHMRVWPFAPRCEQVEEILSAKMRQIRTRRAALAVETSADVGGFSDSDVESPSSPMYSLSVPGLSGLESGGGLSSPVYASSVSDAAGAEAGVNSPSSPVYSLSAPGLHGLEIGGGVSSPVYASSVSGADGADESVDSPSLPECSSSVPGLSGPHGHGDPCGPGFPLSLDLPDLVEDGDIYHIFGP